jgi:hypothetical protein
LQYDGTGAGDTGIRQYSGRGEVPPPFAEKAQSGIRSLAIYPWRGPALSFLSGHLRVQLAETCADGRPTSAALTCHRRAAAFSSYNGPSSGFDEATALGLSPDGSRVFVTGASRGSGTSLDDATLAYDASNGHQLWVKRYTGDVTGGSTALNGFFDFATLAYSLR